MRGIRVGIGVVAMTGIFAGCSGGSGTPPATVTVRDTQTKTVSVSPSATASAPTETPTPSASAAARSWTMPDLVGKNLQDAQDAIQLLTNNEVFYTGSTDLTGQGRNQIMDRNWQVCSSTPSPGATFTKDTAIDFGVVRIDSESCP
jgi:hypothetical protein